MFTSLLSTVMISSWCRRSLQRRNVVLLNRKTARRICFAIFFIVPIAAVSYGITQIPPTRKSIISAVPTTKRLVKRYLKYLKYSLNLPCVVRQLPLR